MNLYYEEFIFIKYIPEILRHMQTEDFINIDDGSQGGTHWTCSIVKDKKSFYFDSFGGQPDQFLLNQLTKPIKNHNYKIQDIDSKLCVAYCLYFF